MSRRCRSSLQDLTEEDGDGSGSSGGCGPRFGSGGTPCTEPLIYGSNIAPSFESIIPGGGGGPSGDEIPTRENAPVAPLVWFSDGSDAIVFRGDPAPYNWVTRYFSGSEPNWKISTVNPDTGTYHMRAGPGDWQTAPEKNAADLIPIGFIPCEGTKLLAWRVEPGAIVSMFIRAMTTGTSNVESVGLIIEFTDIAGDPIGSGDIKTTILTTSYASYTHQVFAPAEAYYTYVLFRSVRNNPGSAVDSTFDFDNPILGITNPTGSRLLCSFASLITIDNSTTETSFV